MHCDAAREMKIGPSPRLSDRKHHILKLALFGSVLREDFRPESDVDVLVEFAPGCVPGPGLLHRPEIVGLRNLLIHARDSVDTDILWQILQEDIPLLIVELQKLVTP